MAWPGFHRLIRTARRQRADQTCPGPAPRLENARRTAGRGRGHRREDGAEAVTTTRVAQQSGVAVGTIYRYFTDRNELLLAAYDATVTRIVAACASSIGRHPHRHATG